MLCRTGVFVVVVLSRTMSANAQEGEPPALGQAAAATDAHDVPPPKKPDRVFGVLPNYGTVEDATEVSIVTTKSTFRMAGHSAKDASRVTVHLSVNRYL
jgi:hypothetical protein